VPVLTEKKSRLKLGEPLTEAQVMALLRDRFAAPEYAFLPHVRNGTGYVRRTTRTADALAMSLWPSRGLELHGIEIKSDRKDWLSEKADPEKAEEIARFCDRWWLVVGHEDIVQPGELPPTWGLLVPGKKKLVMKVEAPKLEAKPLDRVQLAAILRKASEAIVPKVNLTEEMELRVRQAEESVEAEIADRVNGATRILEHELARERQIIETFEKAAGVALSRWEAGNIGAAVRFVLAGGMKGVRGEMEGWRGRAHEIAKTLDEQLADVDPLKTGTEG
jgi:hypothetical protein